MSYTYPASGAASTRPHAVTQIILIAGGMIGGTISFAYDANGALMTQSQVDGQGHAVPGKSRSQFYTSFGMPQSMGQGTTSAAFYYGPEHQRVKQISSVQGTTVYVNPGNNGDLFFEKDVKPDGSIQQRAFITAGGQAVAIVKLTTVGSTTTTSIRYLHRDNLGSVTTITNEAGTVIERLAYEPFGKRRFANGSADSNNTILPQNTDRGFTGHEMIDKIGLIHMNGRVYDPLVGGFLSADPMIQDPNSLQSYNRYAYCINNPIICTDPSGYNWLSKAWKKVWHNPVVRVAAAVAVAWFAPEISAAIGWSAPRVAMTSTQCILVNTGLSATLGIASSAVASGILGGAMAGGILGGDLRSAAIGGITGGIGAGVSEYFGSALISNQSNQRGRIKFA